MTQGQDQNQNNDNNKTFSIVTLSNVYGQFAFGVVSLITIWLTIVNPVMQSQKIDYATHLKIVEEQNKLIYNLAELSRIIRDVAKSLNVTIQDEKLR